MAMPSRGRANRVPRSGRFVRFLTGAGICFARRCDTAIPSWGESTNRIAAHLGDFNMAVNTNTTPAVGVFSTRNDARDAVRSLQAAGFTGDQIGAIYRDETLAYDHSGIPNDPTGSRWEEGTGVGAAAGAAGGLGLGLAVAAGLIPGIGPVVAGGVLMALLASAGAGAAVGTVVGGLIGLGIPEDDATYYESEMQSGRSVVIVRAAGRRIEALDIMRRHGAVEREPVAMM
jgi:hypothetical protein